MSSDQVAPPGSLSPARVALNLLCFQSEHIESVHEEIDYSWTVVTRTSTIRFVHHAPLGKAPSKPLPPYMCVPIASAIKGQVVTIGEVSSPSGPARLLTHSEHQDLAIRLLRLHAGTSHRHDMQSPEARNAVRAAVQANASLFREIVTLTGARADTARESVVNAFAEFREAHPGAYSNKLIDSFESLCSRLAKAYVIFAEIAPKDRAGCEVTWTLQEPPYGRPIPLKHLKRSKRRDAVELIAATGRDWVGDGPSSIYIQTPLANMTDNYHLKMPAPPGRFVHSISVGETTWDRDDENRLRRTTVKHPDELWQADERVTPYLHAYIADGTKTKIQLGVGVGFSEYPLGSMLGPTTAAALGLISALSFTLFRANDFFADQTGTFVALVMAGSLTPALTFGRHDGETARFGARAMTLVLTLLAFAFGGWWAGPEHGNASLTNFNYAWPGMAIIASYFLTLAWGVFGLVRTVADYRWERAEAYRRRSP